MSEKRNVADECLRLLDDGAKVVLYRNGLGSYTAVSLRGADAERIEEIIDHLCSDGPHITDDFLPSKALHRLAEKSIGNIL